MILALMVTIKGHQETAAAHAGLVDEGRDRVQAGELMGPDAEVLWKDMTDSATLLMRELGDLVAYSSSISSLMRQQVVCMVFCHAGWNETDAPVEALFRTMLEPYREATDPIEVQPEDTIRDELELVRLWLGELEVAWAPMEEMVVRMPVVEWTLEEMEEVVMAWRVIELHAAKASRNVDRAMSVAREGLYDWWPQLQPDAPLQQEAEMEILQEGEPWYDVEPEDEDIRWRPRSRMM
jgi:hypothetical protein